MNSAIILGGQQPDLVNALARGQQARAVSDANQRQNALRNVFQTQGQNILAGDPAALETLAQHDPGMAADIQSKQELMAQRRAAQRIEMDKYARALSAEQAAAEAAEIQRTAMQIVPLYRAGDLNGINRVLTELGEPTIGDIEDVPFALAAFDDAFSALKGASEMTAGPEEPAAMTTLRARAEAAGLRQGTPEFENFMLTGGKQEPSKVVKDASGNVVYAEGAAAIEPPKLTVDAGKNTGFLIRLNDAQEVLNSLESEGLSFFQQNAENVPLGIGNYFVSEDFQRFDQARRDFVNAILRRESGAVISDQEFDNAEKQYFPIPGDSEAVIAQKRQNRQNAIKGVRAGSGPGAAYVDQLQEQETTPEEGGLDSQPQFQFENDQQRQLFDKYAAPIG